MNRFTVILAGALIVFAAMLTAGCKNKRQEAEKKRIADSIARANTVRDSLARRASDSLHAAEEAEQNRKREAEVVAQRERAKLKFHVILGSFRVPSNADGFHSRMLQSYPAAKIFNAPNGFKLVSVADFDSMQGAVAFINRARSGQDEPEDMWVYEEGGVYDTSSWLSEE